MEFGDPNSSEQTDGEGTSQQEQEQDRVKSLQSQVNEVKDIMVQNVDLILTRGERLDDLRTKTEGLEAGAQNFNKTSRKVACGYWWKKLKLIVIIVIVLVIILIIIFLATGVIPINETSPTETPP